jgi:pyridoxamine 5'-phosphate oxidase
VEAPLEWFQRWYKEAVETEPRVPDAMQLATVDSNGRPRVRTVLMKGLDSRGLVFYTNYDSPKAVQLEANLQASACFHWKDIARQVIISGPVSRLSAAESDAYFASRGRGSRIGAWASQQSQPIESREALLALVEREKKRFEGQDIPRPAGWGGYRIEIDHWEFWQDHPDRLHDRWIYRKRGDGWNFSRVQP